MLHHLLTDVIMYHQPKGDLDVKLYNKTETKVTIITITKIVLFQTPILPTILPHYNYLNRII